VIREHWGIRSGFFTTVHAYTNSQMYEEPATFNQQMLRVLADTASAVASTR